MATMPTLAATFNLDDYDGDGRSGRVLAQRHGRAQHDMAVWRNLDTGANAIWRSANPSTQIGIRALGSPFDPCGVGDFNGDGRSDVCWRNVETGENRIWLSGAAVLWLLAMKGDLFTPRGPGWSRSRRGSKVRNRPKADFRTYASARVSQSIASSRSEKSLNWILRIAAAVHAVRPSSVDRPIIATRRLRKNGWVTARAM